MCLSDMQKLVFVCWDLWLRLFELKYAKCVWLAKSKQIYFKHIVAFSFIATGILFEFDYIYLSTMFNL